MKHMTDYESDLHEWLKSPENAAAYLNAVLEEGDKSAMLLALREVAQANGGMTAIAERSHVKRESLYQMLSKRGNPELTSLFNVLHGMGRTITILCFCLVGPSPFNFCLVSRADPSGTLWRCNPLWQVFLQLFSFSSASPHF
ncbi:addiction module antidote protein [Pelobacter propionicus]|nr:addiction module antidote protein [Pelobacter propionicus]